MTNTHPKPEFAAVPWKRVAVFVSSTFSDMPFDFAQGRHAEPFDEAQGRRVCLVKRVFPDLHDGCEQRRQRLVNVACLN